MTTEHIQTGLVLRRCRLIGSVALAAASLAMLSACSTPSTTASSSSATSTTGFGPPIRFTCNDTPPSTVVARYREPDAASMTLRRADGVAELQRQPSGSGARYAGGNVEFWEHQGEVTLRWGPNAVPLRCVRER